MNVSITYEVNKDGINDSIDIKKSGNSCKEQKFMKYIIKAINDFYCDQTQPIKI